MNYQVDSFRLKISRFADSPFRRSADAARLR